MTNKIALVTGGRRGLGKDMALRLAQHGHNVVITYVSQKEAAEEVVKEIEGTGGQSSALHLDTNNISSLPGFINEFSQTIQTKWNVKSFDFLINNAGIGATIPF